jgi:hypothetical protein
MNKLIQFKADNRPLFTVKASEIDLNKMNLRYLGQEEYNFKSGEMEVTFTSILPLKTLHLFTDQQKIKVLEIANAKPIIDFICNHCEQEKHDQASRFYLNGLGVDPHKLQTICSDCIDKVDIIRPKYYE